MIVVVARDQRGDRRRELFGKRRAGGGGGKPNLGFERQRRQPLVLLARARLERRHIAQGLCRAGNQEIHAEAIARRLRRGPQQPDRIGADHIGPCRRAQQALRAVALPPFLDALDEALALELAKVIVQPLPREPEAAREAGGGVRLGQPREELTARALQDQRRLSGAADHLDTVGGGGGHALRVDPTN